MTRMSSVLGDVFCAVPRASWDPIEPISTPTVFAVVPLTVLAYLFVFDESKYLRTSVAPDMRTLLY